MKQGPTEKAIIEQAVRGRKKLPDAIANAPDLFPGIELYYVAFMDLSSSRTLGATEGPIAWSVIDYYCRSMQFSDEQKDDTFYYIGAMDKAYLEYRAKKPESAPKPALKKKAKKG